MSRSQLSAAAFVLLAAGACLVWGGSNLHGQTTPLPPGVAADALTLPGVESTAAAGVVPGAPPVPTEGVAAIPLPPSAYPGMIGLATAAYAGWRYRRRRRR